MERRLFAFAIIAFFLELCLYLGDLGVIPLPFFADSSVAKQLPAIGEVEIARREVRRRGFESTIWEDSVAKEVLFERDSLLTLAGSSAKLKLKGDTHIELRENTLVVLEPIEDEDGAPFRLRFSRGDVRARTTLSNVVMQSGEWVLTATAGSDLNLRAIDAEKVEVDVAKGQVDIKHKNQSNHITLEENQRLTLRPEEAGPILSASPELKWENESYLRFYSHQFPHTVTLSWEGEASRLEIASPGEGIKELPLKSNQRKIQIPFQQGSFSASLKGASGISKSLTIEVLLAPKFIYLTPLPRDRAKTGDRTVFAWLSESQLPRYRLEFSEQQDFNTIIHVVDVNGTRAETPLPGPGDLYWHVIGYDEDNFMIPANHAYPIFSLPDPLAPPRLRAPTSNEDSEAKATLLRSHKLWWLEIFRLLIPQANGEAKPLPPVIFNWDALPGADFYIIEISDESNFRNPLVVAKTSTNFYAWARFAKGVYYYRVAGGSLSGRKGAFSKPEKVDLTVWPLPKKKKLVAETKPPPTILPDNPVDKMELPPSPPPPVIPPPSQASSTDEFVGPMRPVESQLRLWWRGLWQYLNLSGEERTDASFNGFTYLALGGDWTGELSQLPFVMRFSFDRYQWTPKLKSQFPFQPDLNMDRLRLAMGWRDRTSPWQVGVALSQIPSIERVSLETIKSKSELAFGAWLAWQRTIEDDQWLAEGRAETTGALTELSFHGQWSSPWVGKWFYGGECELRSVFGVNQGFIIQTGIHVGSFW